MMPANRASRMANAFLHVPRFDRYKARLGQRVHRHGSDQKLVFHYDDDERWGADLRGRGHDL